MHPINRALRKFGFGLSRLPPVPRDFDRAFRRDIVRARENTRGFEVFEDYQCDIGQHPEDWSHAEASFISKHLSQEPTTELLDIGSNRYLVIGLLATMRVTTVDVRERTLPLPNERVISCDAKALDLPSESFDVVTSLCTLEHIGLARYGDEFDLDGDLKGMREMIRVLKPGGRLLFSTTLTRGAPSIAFNAHRIYNLAQLHAMSAGTTIVDELFYSHKHGVTSHDKITPDSKTWDVYCGAWRKNA